MRIEPGKSTGLRVERPIGDKTSFPTKESQDFISKPGNPASSNLSQAIKNLDFPSTVLPDRKVDPALELNMKEIGSLLGELNSQVGYKQTAFELKNAALVFSVFKGLLKNIGALKSKEMSVEVPVSEIKASEKMKIEFIRAEGKVFARLAE